MASLQLLSDLHLEFPRAGAEEGKEVYHYDLLPAAPNLVLLGDIGCTVHDRLFTWLEQQLPKFQRVFYVPGNHEPYRSSVPDSIAKLEAFAADHVGHFILLNRTRYDISPTATLVGCTLWSQIQPEGLEMLSRSLNDFHRIENWNPTTYQAAHETDLKWLNETITHIATHEPHRSVIVLTHHAPTIAGTSAPQFIGGLSSSAFATELTGEPCWNPAVVKLWAYGHTHFNADFERNGVRVYSNQRGYQRGEIGYDPGKTVTC